MFGSEKLPKMKAALELYAAERKLIVNEDDLKARLDALDRFIENLKEALS